MLKKGKKKLTKMAMKAMMNPKVAKTVMTAFQKKQELNEKLARMYATAQMPSLADHEAVNYAIEKVRRRIKGLEKELSAAEFALEKVESAIEREGIKAEPEPKTAAKPPAVDLTDISLKKKPKAKAAKRAKKPAVRKAKPKAVSKKKPAKAKRPAKSGAKSGIAPLGAAGATKPKTGGLLDIDFKKKRKKAKTA